MTLAAVPSTDPADFLLNVHTFDEAINSQSSTFVDRLGVTRSTLEGAIDSLKAWNERGQWLTATAYAVKDVYTDSGLAYAVLIAHTSTSISADLAAGKVSIHQGVTFADLAAPSCSSLVGDLPAGSGAVADTVKARLDETISVFCAMTPAQKADVRNRTFLLDVTLAINIAISVATVCRQTLHIPAGLYRTVPATNKTDESGNNKCAFPMASNLHILADKGAVFKVANGISTNGAPINFSMFFSNEVLSDISFVNLEMDMNGANNQTNGLAHTTAAIIFSGTLGGVAARCDRMTIDGVVVRNTPGATCIGAGQSNTPGTILGKHWFIRNSRFENVGLSCSDHSSIYLWARDSKVHDNTFTNDVMYNAGTSRGGLVTCELHGSNSMYYGNTIRNYYQGIWIASNYTDAYTEGTNVWGNNAYVSEVFADFYSRNIVTGLEGNESRLRLINIHNNIVTISDDVVPDAIKQMVRIAAVQQPLFVNIHHNTLLSKETTKNTAMVAMVVQPSQVLAPLSINVNNNTAAGINVGLACYFNNAAGLVNIDSVSFEHNDLGTLVASPGALYPGTDVYLYGAQAGKISAFRVAGLAHPVRPITTDGAVGGRATVYGKALLDLPVTWSGVTIGNGGYSKKIALDTDTGHAIVDIGFTAGGSTTYSGNISPTITGLVADATATSSATHFKGGAALALPNLIFNTASAISLYTAAGAPFDSSQTTTGSYVFVNANFPCRSASI